MDLTLTEEQELIQATAREVLEARYATAGARAMENDPAGYSTALWKEMVELGWTGLALPESHGGLGAGFLEVCLVIEQMGHFQVPSPLLATVAGCGLPIARYGTEEQRAEWLGAIARGRVMSPVPARWDRTDAEVVATEGGDEFVLDGTARLVPWAHVADDLLVVARLGDGPVTLVVETASPGVTVEPLAAVGADRTARVGLSGVRVPAGRALPDGAAAGAAISAYGAAATCAELVGVAQRVLDMTVEYATQREQFGKPIGTFQAVQHHCADMAMDVLTSRFIAYEAIWRLSAERAAAPQESPDVPPDVPPDLATDISTDVAMAVSMAKAWVSEAAERVCARGHQVHGAIGFTREHDLHLYSRHAMAAALSFGDGDFHWERVARRLDLPRP